MSYRPKLRTILLLLNIMVLLLPLGGIAILRLYESELVKQTESELISQAALTAAMFRETYLKQLDAHQRTGHPITIASLGLPRSAPVTTPPAELMPLPPQLDLAKSRIRQPALPAEIPTVAPDPLALLSGSELNSVLTNARKIVLSGIRIVDHNGIVVASSNIESGLSLAAREEVARALKGEQTTLLRVRNSDVKTPSLTSIHGAIEILKDHYNGMDQGERENFLGIIDNATGRLERLVRRLLDLARADTFTPGDEQSDALEILESVALRYREQGVAVSLEYGTEARSVRMARETFESVVSNLIENARQHGGAGVQVEIVTRIASATGQRMLMLDLHNSGVGVSAGNRDKIFRPFFTTARESGGSGLGLSIVQSLLHAHGGSISLEPSKSGALFRVTVPLC